MMTATSSTVAIFDCDVPYVNPLDVSEALSEEDFFQILHSEPGAPGGGRYSFLYLDPFDFVSSRGGYTSTTEQVAPGDPFEALNSFFERWQTSFSFDTLTDGFKAPIGLVGYLGYELLHHLEPSVVRSGAVPTAPDLMMAAYDAVVCFDHERRRAKIFSSGLPEEEASARRNRAKERAAFLQRKILASLPDSSSALVHTGPLNAQGPTHSLQVSSIPQERYTDMVRQARDYIHAGDVFQVNVSHEFEISGPLDLHALFKGLCAVNPVSYAAYCRFPEIALVSNSPERFLSLDGRGDTMRVSTNPIKGTAKRSVDDPSVGARLAASEKDRAENIMIVDLMRNDLSRVCTDDSVEVTSLCEVEAYKTLYHLVSEVSGTLREGIGPIDVLKACFPGGSITGAPKVRAMQIISELEKRERGPYCGSIGYIGFDGTMDLNIAIRTVYAVQLRELDPPKAYYPVGCGIVADSNPESEWEESLTKALNLLTALSHTNS